MDPTNRNNFHYSSITSIKKNVFVVLVVTGMFSLMSRKLTSPSPTDCYNSRRQAHSTVSDSNVIYEGNIMVTILKCGNTLLLTYSVNAYLKELSTVIYNFLLLKTCFYYIYGYTHRQQIQFRKNNNYG